MDCATSRLHELFIENYSVRHGYLFVTYWSGRHQMPPNLLKLLSLSWVTIHNYMVRLLWLKAAQCLAIGHVEIYLKLSKTLPPCSSAFIL